MMKHRLPLLAALGTAMILGSAQLANAERPMMETTGPYASGWQYDDTYRDRYAYGYGTYDPDIDVGVTVGPRYCYYDYPYYYDPYYRDGVSVRTPFFGFSIG